MQLQLVYCTDIGGKMGTAAIGIRIGTCIGLGIGSVETLLHITIKAICIGVGLGIGVRQWKHTMRSNASFAMITWDPLVDRQTALKTLPSRNSVGGR